MKNFIEVPYDGKVILINVNNISVVAISTEETSIHLVGGDFFKVVNTSLSYKEVKALIEAAQ